MSRAHSVLDAATWRFSTVGVAVAVLLPFAQAVAAAKKDGHYKASSRLLMRAEGSSSSSSSRVPALSASVSSGTAAADSPAALLDLSYKVKETITTTQEPDTIETTEFLYEPTEAPQGSTWVLVTPDTGLPTQGVPSKSTFMRCSSDNPGEILVDAAANSQGKCQIDAMSPPVDFKTGGNETVTSDMVRYYQYCEHCDYGKRCELVLWCLKVQMFPDATEEGPDNPVWRVYRNGETVGDMWTLAAGHSMCQLPRAVTSMLKVNSTFADEKALTADHQLACQEYAVRGGHGYYQFCGSCIGGNRCMVLPVCDKCMSFDSTNWHVFKSDLAGPPCETNR
eukprot:TRINITY_DN121989_c0_g1_i1.p1 TRINITY_DN121989_c0_g1~~TRINITY_DN121989_c0_g1_i1.p1  ORF type:complete len:371 (+),score=64.32 TRINITY_DN121989_c0_g1_i1:103-1113(+)